VPKTQRDWIKILQREGWTRESGGKHQVKMTKAGHRPITLPEHKRRAYSKGFEAALRREAGLGDGQD
jgi:predicted RNA binding protein YcfA (HicA-like mRNA interferase family)